MEPFFFGKSDKQLFGIYHPPKSETIHNVGVVLCYPMGHEYIYSHRAFLRLALKLSSAGFHVLRFDFFGCGDSEGDCEQWEIQQWIDDIKTAVDELKAGSGVDQICLVGLGLGASLATIEAADRGDIDSIVLWDPIVNGKTYFKELAAAHQEKIKSFFRKQMHSSFEKNNHEVLGFPLSNTLVADIGRVDLCTISQKPAKNILLIESSKTENNRRLKEYLKDIGAQVHYELIPASKIWIRTDDEQNQGMVSLETLQFITSWLCEVAV